MNKSNPKNINIAWAELLIEDCLRHGIRQFCIAPGSRSTPLTLAVANHPGCQSLVHFDERGLGFFALGLAKASRQTVAIITTSGTAVANLYPAVIEARQTGVPLLILSADRPQELLAVGANQAIDQRRIFSDYPIYQASLAEPNLAMSPSCMLTELGQALAMQQQTAGPVHLNCPYREPFYPQQARQDLSSHLADLTVWHDSDQPYYQVVISPQSPTCSAAWSSLDRNSKVLVVVGKQLPEQTQAIIAWAEQHHWPVVVDCQSHWQVVDSKVITQADLLLANQHFATANQPDLVIQFGAHLVAKRLSQWLAKISTQQWLIDPAQQRLNPKHQQQIRWQCQPTTWLKSHLAKQPSSGAYLERWLQAQQQIQPIVQQHLQDYSELSISAQISALQAPGSTLFMGNSMVIRTFELLGQSCAATNYFANRGASGIDGLLATSVGISQALAGSTSLVIGDTSLLHDLNSLALASRNQHKLVIILLNNQGGEIFSLLPELGEPEQHQQLAEDYYQLPQQTNFAAAAQLFNLPFHRVSSKQQFEQAFKQAQQHQGASLIEVCFSAGDASRRYQALLSEVSQQHAL
ncbi:2-succinyl-5-enolpyruvyl-6-hydroxy-3-cyclohexene-1-carboxylic-acid synthase [Agarivorans sp. QJM3NY_25]|uniref:2-succinyl-5-enolpyruvyl-6-hydroxy-3- cyclohexene-1-carboxylic-acid synthase n=1 Tax=Agarivorans sp. QJM3NY_25 TaxID=3421430 RepID=UPI003D7D26AD